MSGCGTIQIVISFVFHNVQTHTLYGNNKSTIALISERNCFYYIKVSASPI